MSDFLMIGGARVPIAASGGADEEYQELGGEVVRSFSGQLLSTVKSRARIWRLQTPPLPESEAQLLVVALTHGSPLTCSGALIGSEPVSCYARGVRTRPVAPLSRLRRVVEFELHEAAPTASPILFWLRAGRPLPAGTSFSRASSAWCLNRDGIFSAVGPHVPRTEWADLDGDGRREPYLLLERAASNGLLRSEVFNDGIWDKNAGAVLVVPGAGVAPDGTATAARIQDNTGSANAVWMLQTVTSVTGAGMTYTYSVYLKSYTGSDETVHIAFWDDAVGWKSRQVTATAEWQRFTLTATFDASSTVRRVGFGPDFAFSADGILAWGAMLESGSVASSYIRSEDAVGVRAADSLAVASPPPPQELTIYLLGQERGSARLAHWDQAIWGVAGTVPQLGIWGSGVYPGGYQVEMITAEGEFTVAHSAVPFDVGDRFELFLRIYADGSIRLDAARDGGAVVEGERTAAPAGGLPDAWGAPTQWIGARTPGSTGLVAVRDVLWLRGADWTPDEVRRLVG